MKKIEDGIERERANNAFVWCRLCRSHLPNANYFHMNLPSVSKCEMIKKIQSFWIEKITGFSFFNQIEMMSHGVDCGIRKYLSGRKKNRLPNRMRKIPFHCRVMKLRRIDCECRNDAFSLDWRVNRLDCVSPLIVYRELQFLRQINSKVFPLFFCSGISLRRDLLMCHNVTRAHESSTSFPLPVLLFRSGCRQFSIINAKMIERKDFWLYCLLRQVKRPWQTTPKEAKTPAWHTLPKFAKFFTNGTHTCTHSRCLRSCNMHGILRAQVRTDFARVEVVSLSFSLCLSWCHFFQAASPELMFVGAWTIPIFLQHKLSPYYAGMHRRFHYHLFQFYVQCRWHQPKQRNAEWKIVTEWFESWKTGWRCRIEIHKNPPLRLQKGEKTGASISKFCICSSADVDFTNWIFRCAAARIAFDGV